MSGNRAVIYTRISQDRTGERAGVERQLIDCRALAERQGLTVVEEIPENDRSASSGRRPGWERVIDLIRSNQVDAVVAWHPDRMYRRTRDLEDLVDLIDDHKTLIYTVQTGKVDLATPNGRLTAKTLGALAQYESEHKSDRIARKHQELAKEGKWKGGNRPFGYMSDGVTIFPEEAEAIREAARMIIDGSSMAAAARRVDEMLKDVPLEDPAKKRKKKDPRSLRDTLLQPRIAGLRQYWPQEERNRFKRQRAETKNDRSTAPFSIPWTTLKENARPAEWEGVLDMETWEAVHATLLAPDRKRTTRRPRKSMLAGLLKCGECFKEKDANGEPVLHSLSYNPRAYTCTRCGKVAITVNAAERHISAKTREALERSPQEIPSDTVQVAAEHPSRIADLNVREEVLVDKYSAGLLSEDALTRGLDKIRAERERLTDEEKRAHRALLEQQQLIQLIPEWDKSASDPLLRGKIIRLVAHYFLVLAVARSGRDFQPGRVVAKWKHEHKLDPLGPPIIPPEVALKRAAENKRKAEATRERGRLRRLEADRKRMARGERPIYGPNGELRRRKA